MNNLTKIEEFKHLFIKMHADNISNEEVLRLAMGIDQLRYELMEETAHDPKKMQELDADLREFARDIGEYIT